MSILRKPKPAPAAPAAVKGKGILTLAKLGAAIEKACAGLDPEIPTVKTLTRLVCAADNGSGIVTTFDDRIPVTVAELDAAIADTQENSASPSTLSALKHARALLAGENPGRRSEPVQHVTIAQMKAHDAALFDAFGWALGAMAAELNRGQPSRSHALGLLNRSANTDARKRLLKGIREFKEADVPRMTQTEWLEYQSMGPR